MGLLSQPEGFEGFVSSVEGLHSDDLAVTNGDHIGLMVVNLAPVIFETRMHLAHDDNMISDVDELFGADSEPAPVTEPLLHRGSDLGQPAVARAAASKRPGIARPVPLDIGGVKLGQGPKVAAFPFGKKPSRDFNVFLRHPR